MRLSDPTFAAVGNLRRTPLRQIERETFNCEGGVGAATEAKPRLRRDRGADRRTGQVLAQGLPNRWTVRRRTCASTVGAIEIRSWS